MAKPDRTILEKATGKLISAIQKEWHNELGESVASESEIIMNSCHDLLKASKQGSIVSILKDKSLTEFIGESWIKKHPSVVPHIRSLELAEPNPSFKRDA